MNFLAGLCTGLIVGVAAGELVAVGALFAFRWAAGRRDATLETEADA